MTGRWFAVCVFVLLLLPLAQMLTGALPLQPLAGVQEAVARPMLDVDAVMRKRFQRDAEGWFGQQYGLHDYLVKTNNQILFSVFGESKGKEGIVVGRGGVLLGNTYIKRSLQFTKPMDFSSVVDRLVLIQRQLRARGKTVIVFVTPSKSSVHPEAIPRAYLKFPHYEPGADYRNFVDQVRRTDIPLVDAVQLIDQVRRDGHPVFPQGGIHWNERGSYLGGRALLAGIEAATGMNIGDLSVVSTTHDENPQESDRDYATLLNLWWPPVRYEVPHLRLRAVREDRFGTVSGAFAGGSFLDQIISVYSSLRVFKEMTQVIYNAKVVQFRPGPRDPVSISTLDWNTDVLSRDFIVLEWNEGAADARKPAWNGFLDDLLAKLTRPS